VVIGGIEPVLPTTYIIAIQSIRSVNHPLAGTIESVDDSPAPP